jgi:predicted MPP superfamily phosphohydrolase
MWRFDTVVSNRPDNNKGHLLIVRDAANMKEVLSRLLLRNLPDLFAFSTVLLIQAIGVLLLFRGPAKNASLWARSAIWIAVGCSVTAVVIAFLLRFARVERHFPYWWSSWGRGLLMFWAVLSVLLVAAFAISRVLPHAGPEHSAARRNFLRGARVILFGAPAAALGYGAFIERVDLRLREQDIPVPGLHPDLDGVRLVQLTDIHLSPFLSERDLDRAIAIANETRAHIALVTGDMITSGGDPLDLCLRHLARLRADAGIFGCMGNHEIYADAEAYAEHQGASLGLRFLRMTAVPLRFGNATLNLAGVDYQRMHRRYLRGAEKLVQPGALNVLMSHNPDVFPVAARQGYQFTLAGHTHGGQVRVEILRQDLNVARFFTPYVDGLYREGSSSIFVSRGIGTIALPARLGAPPEVALLKLCRT